MKTYICNRIKSIYKTYAYQKKGKIKEIKKKTKCLHYMKVTFHVFISLTLLFQSVKEQAYDYHSAIYHLLQDKYKKHPKTIQKTIVPQNLPLAVVSTERRSSITTGIGMYHYTLEPYIEQFSRL